MQCKSEKQNIYYKNELIHAKKYIIFIGACRYDMFRIIFINQPLILFENINIDYILL
jgi:hypothetical protein